MIKGLEQNHKVILCEGKNDVGLLEQLISKRGVTRYQVRMPSVEPDFSGGWTKFGKWLKGIRLDPVFSSIPAFIVVADNDENPAQRFSEIRRQLQDAGWCGVPSKPLQIVSSPKNEDPKIAVIMLPGANEAGNLETLCLKSAYDKWANLRRPLDDYIQQTPAKGWSITKQSKTRIQCLISATCETKPEATLHNLWQEDPKYQFDLNHTCFAQIADFLARVG